MISPIDRSVDGGDTKGYDRILKPLQPEGLLRLRGAEVLFLILLKSLVRIAVPGLAAPVSLEEPTSASRSYYPEKVS